MKLEEEIEQVSGEIARLREIGTSDARKWADTLETRLIVLRQNVVRMEMLTIERMKEWSSKILADVQEKGKARHEIESWPLHLRNEMFEAMQVAWAVCKFRARDTAEMLGVSYGLVLDWLKTGAWAAWLDENPRRESQVKTVADMALQRSASILALDTDDPDILKVQSATIKTILTAGLTVTKNLPDAGGGRKAGKPRQGLPSSRGDQTAKRSFEK